MTVSPAKDIPKIVAEDSFLDVRDGVTKHFHGLRTEALLNSRDQEAVKASKPEVFFQNLGDTAVLAHVRLNIDKNDPTSFSPSISENTVMNITLRVQGQDKESTIKAFTIHPPFDYTPGNLLLVVTGQDPNFFTKGQLFSTDTEHPRWYRASVGLTTNGAGLERNVSAMQAMSEESAKFFHHTYLNPQNNPPPPRGR